MEFIIKDRETEVTGHMDTLTLSVDGTVRKKDIVRFEKENDCLFRYVMPFTKHGGAHWISIVFRRMIKV